MKSEEAAKMIAEFEDGSLPKEKWTHHAHFVMALWYCFHLPLPEAVQRIKEGIQRYNIAIGGANTADAGYHETITVFYISAICYYIIHSPGKNNVDILLAALAEQPFMDKDFPLQFYSRGLVMSSEARKGWVIPDKLSFCFAR
jgi:hypothetical protein